MPSRAKPVLALSISLIVLLLILTNAVTEAGCQHYRGGANCPQEAPCCKSGWCSNAESFCSLALGCQPENSFSPDTCLPLPRCTSFFDNFDRPNTVIALTNFSGDPLDAPWTSDFMPNNARIENGNLILTLKKNDAVNKFGNRPGFGATVSSTRWMLYGTVSARIKSGSPSGGIVSSFIYRNAVTGDEVDYEWVGKQPNEVQSNYYWNTPSTMDPKDIDYSHSRRQDLGINLSQEYQTYTIEWLPDRLTWFINGHVVRTLLKSEVNGTQYPSTPSQIQFSVWDGGLGDSATMEWAGGPTHYEDNQAPYEMFVDFVDVKCFTPVDPATTPWPPKDKGFQGIVNPLAKDPALAKEAIVLGDNAPTFSTLENGGLHWGRFNGGKSLNQNYPFIPKKNAAGRLGDRMQWGLVSFISALAIYTFSAS